MKILLCGDTEGIKQLLDHIENKYLCGIVAASIREEYVEDICKLAQKNCLEFFLQPSFSTPEYQVFIDEIFNISPDLILVNSYSMIIRDDFLAIAKYGGLNIHGALLPRGRGPHPEQWAILNGDNVLGVTLHEISSTVDGGNIVDQISIPLVLDDTWIDIRSRLYVATNKLLKRNIHNIISRSWTSQAQSDKDATRGRKRYPKDSDFTFDEPVIDIYNKIRALLPPLPSAFCIDKSGNRIEYDKFHTIWQLTNIKYTHSLLNISSDRFSLRPVLRNIDFFSNDYDVREGFAGIDISFFSTSMPEFNSWLARIIDNRTDAVFFTINDVPSDKILGFCSFTHISIRNRSVRLDINLKGQVDCEDEFFQDTIRMALQYVYGELKLRKVEVRIDSSLIHLLRLYRGCGFYIEGELKDADFIDESWITHTLMAKFLFSGEEHDLVS